MDSECPRLYRAVAGADWTSANCSQKMDSGYKCARNLKGRERTRGGVGGEGQLAVSLWGEENQQSSTKSSTCRRERAGDQTSRDASDCSRSCNDFVDRLPPTGSRLLARTVHGLFGSWMLLREPTPRDKRGGEWSRMRRPRPHLS